MPHYLGVDIGTTNVKALLVNGRQRIIAQGSEPVPTLRRRAGWSEQHPKSWWSAFTKIGTALRRQAPRQWADVAAIGLTGQMHACLCLDERNLPLRPAILWNDGRALSECIALAASVPGLREIVGVAPMPGFTAPKFLWLARHEPQIFDRIAHVLLAKDYVRLRLTGEHLTDVSDAAGSLMLDQGSRQWSRAILAAIGLSIAQLPRLVEGTAAASVISAAASRQLGLSRDTIVAGGGGDVAAGAVGIGAVDDGDAFISLGTSAQYFLVRNRYRLPSNSTIHAFAHCLPSRWYEMAALLNGASCLAWITRLLDIGSLDTALKVVSQNFSAPSPLLFLPYLAGERTPHNDPALRAMMLGISHTTAPADLVRAVLEGVALALADVQSCLDSPGSLTTPIAIIGGGARSLPWVQIIADVLGRDVVVCRDAAAAAPLGAARLARMAFTGETVSSVCTRPPVLKRLRPRRAAHTLYRNRLELFRQSQAALSIAKAYQHQESI
jgi:xylulokinase